MADSYGIRPWFIDLGGDFVWLYQFLFYKPCFLFVYSLNDCFLGFLYQLICYGIIMCYKQFDLAAHHYGNRQNVLSLYKKIQAHLCNVLRCSRHILSSAYHDADMLRMPILIRLKFNYL